MTLRNFSSTAAETTLAAGVSAANTTLQVASTTGFPAAPFILAVDAGSAAQELVLVTAVAGTTLTVTRAYDSTVAGTHEVGAVVQHSHAALDFREANAHVNATTGVHGAAGSVVGTSDAQTLTNKTVSLGSNTVTGTKAQFNTACTDADFATLTGTETLTGKTLTTPTITTPVLNGAVTGTTFGAWAAYTPTWTASTTNPTLGNGTLTGNYLQVGKLIMFRISLLFGSTTTVGSGLYSFTVPTAALLATYQPAGNAQLLDSSVPASVPRQVSFSNSATTLVIQDHAGAYLAHNVPYAWAVGDRIIITGQYEAA